MSQHFHETIAALQAQITEEERRLNDRKRAVNILCDSSGVPRLYPDDQMQSGVTAGIRSDEFYGRPLATVVREILQKRRAASLGAASVPEIFDAMVAGGYEFNTKNEENSKRGLYISLGKNTTTFHRLPNGRYGLLEWYPAVKEPKQK